MKMMAASMKTEGGSRETGRAIYSQILENSGDPMVRLTADRRLKELDSLDEREAIDRVLAEFKERSGHCVNNFTEIIPMLMTVKLPGNKEFRVNTANQLVDPTDVPYLLDKNDCRAKLDLEHTGLPADAGSKK